jgi:hypothetical protein
MQVFPRANGVWMNYPDIGVATESLARGVIGTVPVEEDGSAHFKIPADTPVYFQAVDGQGRAVQTMRSATWIQPGATVSCQGCHEPKHRAPKPARQATLAAARRPPSRPKAGPAGSYPIFYPKLVQPVLDRRCVACHAKQRKDGNGKAPDLSGEPVVVRGMSPGHGPATVWSRSYRALTASANCQLFGGKPVSGNPRTRPGSFGSMQSPLYPLLAGGKHHDVALTSEELQRFSLWLDNNLNFYGAYLETGTQVAGTCIMPPSVQPDRPQVRSPTPSEILAQVRAKASRDAPKSAAGREPAVAPPPKESLPAFDMPKLSDDAEDVLDDL